VCGESRTHGSEGGKVSRDTYLSRRLTAGAYAITLTRYTEDGISAFVANGDGKNYSVVLTASRSLCGCRDSMFRGKTCKHTVSLALYEIRTLYQEIFTSRLGQWHEVKGRIAQKWRGR
jgi:hypothetical protein